MSTLLCVHWLCMLLRVHWLCTLLCVMLLRVQLDELPPNGLAASECAAAQTDLMNENSRRTFQQAVAEGRVPSGNAQHRLVADFKVCQALCSQALCKPCKTIQTIDLLNATVNPYATGFAASD